MHVAVVWRQGERVIGLFDAFGDRDARLDLYLLRIRIALNLVIDVPTKSDKELVDKIFANLRFAVLGPLVMRQIGREMFYEFSDLSVGLIESVLIHIVKDMR